MTLRTSMIAILTATTLTVGVANAKVKTESTQDFDIRNYGTYSWATETATDQPLCEADTREATTSESIEDRAAARARLQETIDLRLAALGIEKIENGGDLTVRVDGDTWEETQVQITDLSPWAYDRYTLRRPRVRSYGWHWTTFPDTQLAVVDTYETTRGALSIELVDPSDGEVVWSGEADGRVRSSEAKNAKKLEKALDKMFRDVVAQVEAQDSNR